MDSFSFVEPEDLADCEVKTSVIWAHLHDDPELFS